MNVKGDWVMQPATAKLLPEYKSMEVRQSDVWIVTYPKVNCLCLCARFRRLDCNLSKSTFILFREQHLTPDSFPLSAGQHGVKS